MKTYDINTKGVNIEVTKEIELGIEKDYRINGPIIAMLIDAGFKVNYQLGADEYIGTMNGNVYLVNTAKNLVEKGFSTKLGNIDIVDFKARVSVIDVNMSIDNKGVEMKNCLRIKIFNDEAVYIDVFTK